METDIELFVFVDLFVQDINVNQKLIVIQPELSIEVTVAIHELLDDRILLGSLPVSFLSLGLWVTLKIGEADSVVLVILEVVEEALSSFVSLILDAYKV